MSAPKRLGTPCGPDCHRPREKSNQAHCTTCHNTLSSPDLFYRHRVGGHCAILPDMGLTEVNGVWATPEAHETFARKSARMRNAKNRTSSGPHTNTEGLEPLPGISVTPEPSGSVEDVSGGSE